MTAGEVTPPPTTITGKKLLPRSLRWAATVVDGAATVPVSRDLWAQAIALHVERTDAGHLLDESPSELALSSELMQTGEVPLAVVEELLAACPQALELDACLRSYSSALSRFESDPKKLTATLVECVLLPLVASLPEAEERTDALERLQKLVPAGSGDSVTLLSDLSKQLRRRLA
jgi:hypothetical protein